MKFDLSDFGTTDSDEVVLLSVVDAARSIGGLLYLPADAVAIDTTPPSVGSKSHVSIGEMIVRPLDDASGDIGGTVSDPGAFAAGVAGLGRPAPDGDGAGLSSGIHGYDGPAGHGAVQSGASTVPIMPQVKIASFEFSAAAPKAAQVVIESQGHDDGSDASARPVNASAAASAPSVPQADAPAGDAVFDVRDYGAVGDGVTVDTAAIQMAIEAAHAAGGGTVYIPRGTYIVTGGDEPSDGCLNIRSNVTLAGDGMGETIIKVQDGWDQKITGIVRSEYGVGTTDFGMRDLTLDGNRAHLDSTVKVDGWFNGYIPGGTGEDRNVTLDRIEIKDCSGYGFDPHERTVNLAITNSISHGNGLDGFVADFQVDGTFANNLAYDNDRHGFNIVTSTNNFTLVNNIARDNGGSGIIVQRGSDNVPSPHHISIIGGELYNNGDEGIEINKSDFIYIENVSIHDNATRGIRLYGSSNSTIINNTIFNNSQIKNAGYEEIGIAIYDDRAGVSGRIYASINNTIQNNLIYDDKLFLASYGIKEASDGSDYNTISGNTIIGMRYGAVQIRGPHSTTTDAASPKTITGNASANILTGTEFGDTISGNDGNDTIAGKDGQDAIAGGNGDDVIDAGSGFDTASGGAANDSIFGGTGNDILQGDAGDDRIDGGLGADTMSGGVGDDVFLVDDIGDVVTENAGEGTDRVESTLTYSLGENVENLVLIAGSKAALIGKGNGLANTLTGNEFANMLTGSGGADVLVGGGGNDTLDGGTGNDVMAGGKGDDISIVDSAGDTVTEAVDEGYDTVRASVSYQLKANIEALVLASGAVAAVSATGNELANALDGNEYDNVLDGGAGIDAMAGKQGDDMYKVDAAGDVVIEGFAGGTDQVDSSVSFKLGDNVEKLVLVAGASAALAATGNDLANTLVGNEFGNTLTGGDGNDTLDGGSGIDAMIGGLGDDIYRVDATGETITENADSGYDRVDSTVGYKAVANIEAVVLVAGASAALLAMGNALDNKLTGNEFDNNLVGSAGDDILLGLDGNDRLDGGTGNDSLFGGAGADSFIWSSGADIFDGGEGVDTVNYQTSSGARLYLDGSAANQGAAAGHGFLSIEYVYGSTTGADFLVGSAVDNRLYGLGGNDQLFGGAGIDSIQGGDGNDRISGGAGVDNLYGNAGADTFVFDQAPNTDSRDRIYGFVTGEDRLEIDASEFGGGLTAQSNAQLVSHSSPSSAGISGAVFLYDTDTGRLSFDGDGKGGASVYFATIDGAPTLSAGDLFFVA